MEKGLEEVLSNQGSVVLHVLRGALTPHKHPACAVMQDRGSNSSSLVPRIGSEVRNQTANDEMGTVCPVRAHGCDPGRVIAH